MLTCSGTLVWCAHRLGLFSLQRQRQYLEAHGAVLEATPTERTIELVPTIIVH